VQVGATDAAVRDLDDGLVVGGLTEPYRLDPEIVGRVRDDAERFTGQGSCFLLISPEVVGQTTRLVCEPIPDSRARPCRPE
jgi:hypothetical protein